MHFGPKIIHEAVGVLTMQEHAGQRGDAQPVDRLAEIQVTPDIHRQIHTRAYDKPVGADDAGAVQQGIDGQGVGVLVRFFDPELAEDREFLGLRESRVNRKPAGGQAISLSHANGAKIAGTQKDSNFVVGVIPLQRVMNPQPGKAEILG